MEGKEFGCLELVLRDAFGRWLSGAVEEPKPQGLNVPIQIYILKLNLNELDR